MRVIDHIDHPRYKISVFDSHDKLSLLIEDGLVAITWKFRKESPVNSPAKIRKLIHNSSLEGLGELLGTLDTMRSEEIRTQFPPPESDFDPII